VSGRGRGVSDRLRLDRLVLEAAGLEDDEREAFLERLRGDDPEIAGRVEERLRAAEDLDDDFLASPATEILAALLDEPDAGAAEPPAGDGRYEIGELLGEGGMARVYRAFDHQLGRPVALKILSTADPETPRRLLSEARAQARVRHDRVLDVYETGELGGRPYIAVRYAAGGTLEDLDGLSLENRVRLVAQAAEGLHAAHREGLLHGDVKPSNVLVEETPDGDLRAWIGDFGIAVELADGGEPTALAGTPRFMAPELRRAAGGGHAGIDRRADVYSLGVTLLQVLTGEPPPALGIGSGTGWAEIHDAAPDLPPDLAAVIARCVAHEPADRYPSARAVAEDLRRFLDGEAVEAYADRLTYRWARFAARHRRLLTVAGVSALLLAAALVVAAVMGVSAVRANARADQRRAQAEELIDFMLLDLRGKLQPVGRLDLLDDVGERALRYFGAVPESELTDGELAHRSTALHQIADVRIQLGDLEGAERPLAESLELARALAARDPDNPDRLFGLGQSEFWAGYAHWERGDLAAARPHFEAYEEVSERLVALEPGRADWRAELSYAHSNLGSLLQAQGDLPGALDRFRRTLAIDETLTAEAEGSPEEGDRRFDLALTHNTVGVVLERMGRLDEAVEHYRADLAIRRALDERDPENRRWREFLGTSHQYLGGLHLARGELGAARRHLEPSRRIFTALVAHDPDNTAWRYKLAWSEIRLGQVQTASGRAGAAREAWERAAREADALTAVDPASFDWRLLRGVAAYHSLTEPAETGPADPARAREVADFLAPLAAERADSRRARTWLARSLLLLGDALAAGGDTGGARDAWERAAAALEPFASGAARDHDVLVPWEAALRRLGRRDEAARVRSFLNAMGVPPHDPVPGRLPRDRAGTS
jgi:eukaryotic-like serine/threonine-protein kinase